MIDADVGASDAAPLPDSAGLPDGARPADSTRQLDGPPSCPPIGPDKGGSSAVSTFHSMGLSPTGSTIDVNDKAEQAFTINASYVIVRGFSIKNPSKWGIRITGGHDIIIEGCEITNWGSFGGNLGFGANYQGAIYSTASSIERIVVRRCTMHHPRTDSNSWSEL